MSRLPINRPPVSLVRQLEAGGLNVRWVPRVGKLCVRYGNKPVWWVEDENHRPRHLLPSDVDRLLMSDTRRISPAQQVAAMEANEGRITRLDVGELRYQIRSAVRTAHKVISREKHGG